MIGLTVLAVIAIYIGLCLWMFRSLKRPWARVLGAIAALALPFWDWPIGYYKFQRLCSEEGGIHVGSKLAPVAAVLVDPSVGYTVDQLLNFGFQTVEYGTANQFDRHSNGSLPNSQKNQTVPISKLRIEAKRNQRLPWNIFQNDLIASRIDTTQVVARQTGFTWLGTWWQSQAAPLFGYGFACFPESSEVLSLIARGKP